VSRREAQSPPAGSTVDLKRRVRELEAERRRLPDAIADALDARDFDAMRQLRQRALEGAYELGDVELRYTAARLEETSIAMEIAQRDVGPAKARVAEVSAQVRALEEELRRARHDLYGAKERAAGLRDVHRSLENRMHELSTGEPGAWPTGNPAETLQRRRERAVQVARLEAVG